MPFNEKGEIIRPKNREKTGSDIQRSTPSNDDDTSFSDIQRSTPSDDIPTSTIFYLSGYLFSFVFFSFLVLYLDLDPDFFTGAWIVSFFWPIHPTIIFWSYFAYYLDFNFFDVFNTFYWSGYLLSLVLNMWMYYCFEEGDDDTPLSLWMFVLYGILNIFFWPSNLLASVISLLIHYFRSFMEYVAFFAIVVIILCVIAFIIGFIIHEFIYDFA